MFGGLKKVWLRASKCRDPCSTKVHFEADCMWAAGNRAGGRGAGGDPGAGGAETNGKEGNGVSFGCGGQLAGFGIPDFHRRVRAAADNPFPIRTECHTIDPI